MAFKRLDFQSWYSFERWYCANLVLGSCISLLRGSEATSIRACATISQQMILIVDADFPDHYSKSQVKQWLGCWFLGFDQLMQGLRSNKHSRKFARLAQARSPNGCWFNPNLPVAPSSPSFLCWSPIFWKPKTRNALFEPNFGWSVVALGHLSSVHHPGVADQRFRFQFGRANHLDQTGAWLGARAAAGRRGPRFYSAGSGNWCVSDCSRWRCVNAWNVYEYTMIYRDLFLDVMISLL